MLILGIDDAGRGPVIGPMILAGILVTKEQEKSLKKIGVADSKILIHSKRIELSKKIEKNSIGSLVLKVDPEKIDASIKSGVNLNTLEAQKVAEIINSLNNKKDRIKIIVDCPSNNIIAWRNTLLSYVEHLSNIDVVCEHKADFNHPSVSAASILAKVRREEEIDKIREKYKEYGNVGSGYPSDPLTKEFLKKNGLILKDEDIFRKTWETWRALFPDNEQRTLKDF